MIQPAKVPTPAKQAFFPLKCFKEVTSFKEPFFTTATAR